MSVLLTKALWYSLDDRNTELIADNQYSNPIILNDCLDLTSRRGLDIKNNLLTIPLKNAWKNHVNSVNVIDFQEEDQIKFYAKYTDDGLDVESIEWDLTKPNNVPEDSFLIGTFFVTEFGGVHSEKSTNISLTCADKMSIIFNRLIPYTFLEGDNMTAPLIIQKICRLASQRVGGQFTGTGADAGVPYDVDAKLESEGGFITSERRSTYEDGTANSVSVFPTVQMDKLFKPVFDWVNDLSQTQYTNSASELATGMVYGRPFIFWLDEGNHFHWVYPNDEVITENEIVVGTTEGIKSLSLQKKAFDVTNMIIYHAGDDFYGVGMLDYFFDETSKSSQLKMRYVPFTEIAKNLANEDYAKLSANNRKGDTAGYPFPQFPLQAQYPYTPSWSTSSVANDSEYNESFRAECVKRGKSLAMKLVVGLGHDRWAGSIEVKGSMRVPGTLLKITDDSLGIKEQLVRIMNVNHHFNKDGWFTGLELEQDSFALIKTNQ